MGTSRPQVDLHIYSFWYRRAVSQGARRRSPINPVKVQYCTAVQKHINSKFDSNFQMFCLHNGTALLDGSIASGDAVVGHTEDVSRFTR